MGAEDRVLAQPANRTLENPYNIRPTKAFSNH
jgi:hypothetical protein